MSEWINNKTVKTRKEHSCFGCNEQISKGETAKTTTYRNDDNEIRTIYECKECIEYEKTECSKCVDVECQDAWDGTYEECYKYQCRLSRKDDCDG